MYEIYARFAADIRADCVRMVCGGGSGHIGSMLSMADILAVLYTDILKIDPKNPKWEGRDRFILSKGHGGAAVYAALAGRGFFPREWLATYYRNGGRLSGHISHHVPGVEFSTGSLGHGLPVAAGMAAALKRKGNSARVFCIMGDGDLNEGSTWEAIMLAAQIGLDNLTVVVDCNGIQALGHSKEIISLEPLDRKIAAFGWNVENIDGHDFAAIKKALKSLPNEGGKPNFIIARTIKSKGISELENTVASHYYHVKKGEDEHFVAEIYGGVGK